MNSIRFKLWTAMMALVAVILVLLWLSQIVFLDRFYTDIRIREIKNSGIEILEELNNKQEFENKLDELAYNNNLTAELLDLQHKTLYATGATGMNNQMPMMRNSLRIEAYEQILQGETLFVPLTHPRFDSRFMLIGLPAIVSGNIEGALILTVPLAPVEDTVNILKKQLFYLTILLLCATLLIAYFLSKSFTKPILEITKASMDMTSGNFSAKIVTTSRDEIGKLAETINNMGKELSKIEQLRKDLIANVSHELRTPLSLIKGYAETIRDISGNNTEKREKHVDIIIEEADRLSRIVNDILNLSQLQAGYMSLNKTKFNIGETLNRVVKKYEIMSVRTGVGIQLKNKEDIFIEADEIKIEQTLYNLINNAYNHSPEGSIISVLTLTPIDSDKVRIEVSDMGKGIPSDEIAYIWDRFYKGDKSGKRKEVGTGLGLAIVKTILEEHKALYGVESRVGEGTTFWFELVRI